jgi:hypothetical protein
MKFKKTDDETIYAWRRAKELCEEVELDKKESETTTLLLAKIHLDPKVQSLNAPPPGYEDRLVASLMAKAEAANVVMPSGGLYGEDGAEKKWFRLASKLIPASVFSFVVVLAFAVFQFMNTPANSLDAKADLWAVAVEDASRVEVSRWLASVSDGASLLMSTDLSVLGSELSEVQLEQALKEGGGT